jgi:hypothetical protein
MNASCEGKMSAKGIQKYIFEKLNFEQTEGLCVSLTASQTDECFTYNSQEQ